MSLPSRESQFIGVLYRMALDEFLASAQLAYLSHFEGLARGNLFRISEHYPKVFTTGRGSATCYDGIWDALIRGGGWEGSVIRI